MTSFLDGLTARDLGTLAGIVGSDPDDLSAELRRRPWRIHDLLSDPDVFDQVVDRHAHPAAVVSPFLLFSVLVHRAAEELREATHVNDWAGPRSRIPVFDVSPLQEYLDDPGRSGFLARLLASFAVPDPLPVPEEDPFDLVALAAWLDALPTVGRAALLRRMGDLALFLTGVFPDRTGSQALRPVDAERLGRGVGMTPDEILSLFDPGSLFGGLTPLETLGSRWYTASLDEGTQPPVVGDVASRFNAARRVLNHLTDRYLYRMEPTFRLAS